MPYCPMRDALVRVIMRTTCPLPLGATNAQGNRSLKNRESLFNAIRSRLLQSLAMWAPGGGSLRVSLHRGRGVIIGDNAWIGAQVMIETAHPSLVRIGNRVVIGVRSTIVAHFQELQGVEIMDDVYIGTGALLLPGVRVGEGAVISAGSVVTTSVPPFTVVQGNPAQPVARCTAPLGLATSRIDFIKGLRKLDAHNGSIHRGRRSVESPHAVAKTDQGRGNC